MAKDTPVDPSPGGLVEREKAVEVIERAMLAVRCVDDGHLHARKAVLFDARPTIAEVDAFSQLRDLSERCDCGKSMEACAATEDCDNQSTPTAPQTAAPVSGAPFCRHGSLPSAPGWASVEMLKDAIYTAFDEADADDQDDLLRLAEIAAKVALGGGGGQP